MTMTTTTTTIKGQGNNGVTHNVYIEDNKIVKAEKLHDGLVVVTYDWSYISVKECKEMASESGHESYTFIEKVEANEKTTHVTVREARKELEKWQRWNSEEETELEVLVTKAEDSEEYDVAIMGSVDGSIELDIVLETHTVEKEAIKRQKALMKTFNI